MAKTVKWSFYVVIHFVETMPLLKWLLSAFSVQLLFHYFFGELTLLVGRWEGHSAGK